MSESEFALLGARIENLSASGALVKALRPAAVGDRALLSFQLPHSEAWLDLGACVTRVVAGRRVGDGGLALGVRFDRRAEHEWTELDRALESLPVTPPGYRAGRRSQGPELDHLIKMWNWSNRTRAA